MFHIMKYHFLGLIRSKSMLFWTLLFPIGLSTFIGVTVGNNSNVIALDTMQIAVVESDAYKQDLVLQEVLKQIQEQEHPLFQVQVTNQKEADDLLMKDDIVGYISYENGKLQANVNQRGITQTIFVSFLNEFQQTSNLVQTMIQSGASQEEVMQVFTQTNTYMESVVPANGDNTNTIYFYAVLAMTMLYGGYWALKTSHEQMADHSVTGMRNALSPTPKSMQLIADLLVTIAIHVTIQIILLFYMRLVLQVDFGNQLGAVLLTIVVGSFAGNALGLMVSMYGSKQYEVNTGILSALTILSATLGGMMMVHIKYFVQENLPFINAINPGSLITDALYAQYYYGIGERFYHCILSLVLITLVLYSLAILRLRRKQYASL